MPPAAAVACVPAVCAWVAVAAGAAAGACCWYGCCCCSRLFLWRHHFIELPRFTSRPLASPCLSFPYSHLTSFHLESCSLHIASPRLPSPQPSLRHPTPFHLTSSLILASPRLTSPRPTLACLTSLGRAAPNLTSPQLVFVPLYTSKCDCHPIARWSLSVVGGFSGLTPFAFCFGSCRQEDMLNAKRTRLNPVFDPPAGSLTERGYTGEGFQRKQHFLWREACDHHNLHIIWHSVG